MTFEEYQKAAVSFRTDTADNGEYLMLGLIAEVGEAAGKLAKRIRDGVFDERAFIKELGDILWFVANLADYYDREYDKNISEDLDDCFNVELDCDRFDDEITKRLVYWVALLLDGDTDQLEYIVIEVGSLAKKRNYTLEQVAEINIAKLRDRAARGVIKGNGDER